MKFHGAVAFELSNMEMPPATACGFLLMTQTLTESTQHALVVRPAHVPSRPTALGK
jgi:hypothetical protein